MVSRAMFTYERPGYDTVTTSPQTGLVVRDPTDGTMGKMLSNNKGLKTLGLTVETEGFSSPATPPESMSAKVTAKLRGRHEGLPTRPLTISN
jgi:hypothetical protein